MTDSKQYHPLPEPDTHCFDEDTGKDVWSHSADQMRAYYALGYAAGEKAAGLQRVSDFCVLQETLETADTLRADLAECRQSLKRVVSTLHAHELAEIGAPNYAEDPAEPRYDRPVGYLPAYELSRLHSGHDAQLRSAKFGPSALDGDVPVYLESSALALVQALIGAQRAINSMKAEAETAAQGDEQMMLDACEQISNEGLEASLAIQAALSTAAQPPADGALNTIAAMFHSGEEIEGPDGLAIMVDMDERLEP